MADEEDESQKTEDPSGRKLGKAREKGQVASSQEVKNWFVLMAGTLIIAVLAPWMMKGVLQTGYIFIEQSDALTVSIESVTPIFVDISISMLLYTAPALGVLMLVAILASVAQSGLLFAPTKIAPKLSNISLMKGFKRMFSIRSVVEFAKSLLKLSLVSLVTIGMTVPFFGDIGLMPDYSMDATMDKMFTVVLAIATGTSVVMTAIAAFDYIYQKFEFTKSMRMSRQELKDEYKDTEGDPQIKARIRRLRAERAQQRMMANVPDADVVVTNPTHYAVALSYKMDAMHAPRLVAKGVDSVAFRIREVAEENDVPIVENPPLARALFASVELDEEIPVEHYQAVAEVIGYVMKLKGNKRGGGGPTIN